MGTEFDGIEDEGGGFFGLALLALAVGAGTALLFAPAEGATTRKIVGGRLRELRGGAEGAVERLRRELGRREARRRREQRTAALVGVAVGAGLAALLLPQSGTDTRRQITRALQRREHPLSQHQAAEQAPTSAPAT
jgi:gas vesicle protein